MDVKGGHGRMDGSGAGAPIPIKAMRDPLRFAAYPLSNGTLALVVRAYGEHEVLVSALIPEAQRRAVALHTIEAHAVGCYSVNCPVAQGWLGSRSRGRPVTAASA